MATAVPASTGKRPERYATIKMAKLVIGHGVLVSSRARAFNASSKNAAIARVSGRKIGMACSMAGLIASLNGMTHSSGNETSHVNFALSAKMAIENSRKASHTLGQPFVVAT